MARATTTTAMITVAVLLLGLAVSGSHAVLPTKCVKINPPPTSSTPNPTPTPQPSTPSAGPVGGMGPASCVAGYTPNSTNVNGTCVPCAKGQTSAGTNATCTNCAAFTWADQEGSAKCSSCSQTDAAMVFTGDASGLNTSYAHNCSTYTLVPKGSYKSSDTATTLCPKGKYADKTGMTECTACAGATWANTTGSTECSECVKPLYYAGNASLTNQNVTLPCSTVPAGSKYKDNNAITACPRGEWQNETGQAKCKTCPAGSVCNNCDKLGSTESNCTACPAGTIYMAPKDETDVSSAVQFYGGGTGNGVKCGAVTAKNAWSYVAGATTLKACPFGTTFPYDATTGESLWNKTVGGFSYTPDKNLEGTCVKECFAGKSDTTAPTTMSPYYGTCIGIPAEVTAVAPNHGVGEYGIAKCGVNTFVNSTGACVACPKNTFSRYGTLGACIACPPKTGRNVTDEFCTALLPNKKCDATTEKSVPDVMITDPQWGDYTQYDGLTTNALNMHSSTGASWNCNALSGLGGYVGHPMTPGMGDYLSRMCPGWVAAAGGDMPGTDKDGVFQTLHDFYRRFNFVGGALAQVFLTGKCTYEEMLKNSTDHRCDANGGDAVSLVYTNAKVPKDDLKDTCAEITPKQCLNAYAATACQKTCKITPSPMVAMKRPAVANPFLSSQKVAWPTNSLNYNPIITKSESDACPSTSGTGGKLFAAWDPRTMMQTNICWFAKNAYELLVKGDTVKATSADEDAWTSMKMCSEGETTYTPTTVAIDWKKPMADTTAAYAGLKTACAKDAKCTAIQIFSGYDKSNAMASEVAYATTISKCVLVDTNLNMGRWVAVNVPQAMSPPPPTPPPPFVAAKAPAGKKAKIVVEVKVTLGGYTVETFGAAEKTSFKAGIAKSVKTTADKVTITKVTAGSRRHLLAGSIAVDFQIETKDAAAAVSVEESIKKADLKEELTSSGLTKVESVSAPVVEVKTIFVDETVVDSAASRVWVSLASILAGAAILALW